MKRLIPYALLIFALMLVACEPQSIVQRGGGTDSDWLVTVSRVPAGETARVTRIIDGDTIDVEMNGQTYRVRYIGMDTPERNERCFREATDANRVLVEGQTIRMERDVSETDRFGRLLRYIYVGDVFVNATLVRQGYAEVRRYHPDVREHDDFMRWRREAAANNRNCHATGVFR
ncbi:MAG: hypothetical protein EA396_07515 [Anaerolineaceae bacterium]|nr:MAG: hypothetical protein EA396_07515 [Anaerolineaceae bacterium]